MAKGPQYKIRLDSGRIVGPIGLERIRKLVLKKHIGGHEQVRLHPDGEWKDIAEYPELADLLIQDAEGKLGPDASAPSTAGSGYEPILKGQTEALLAPTVVLGSTPPETPHEPTPTSLAAPSAPVKIELEGQTRASGTATLSETEVESPASTPGPTAPEAQAGPEAQGGPETEEPIELETPSPKKKSSMAGYELAALIPGFERPPARNLAEEPTVPFIRRGAPGGPVRARSPRQEKRSSWIQGAIAAGVFALVGWELLYPARPGNLQQAQRPEPVRPRLPSFRLDLPADPARSAQLVAKGLTLYHQDTVEGYRKAADHFLGAASLDPGNVQALALLASSYLNLIDSSNKDETYFSVISKVIDLSRAKNMDLPETVIADVEFYLVAHRAEAAKQRLVEYTKANKNFEPTLFYYTALVFLAKHDPSSASRYIQLLPDARINQPRIRYFRGQLAESFGQFETAVREYGEALKLNPAHAKSRLRLIELMSRASRLHEAEPHLRFLVQNPGLLAPKDLARAYYLASLFYSLGQKWDLGLGYVERAVKLDPENHDYRFEMYTLRGRLGDKLPGAKRDAQMYLLLGEGEKLQQQGRYQEAMTRYLEARKANLESTLPLLKLGDMFVQLHEIGNARMNYQLAAERAPNNIQVWSRYIDVLIQSFEWSEAQKAMDRFRNLPVGQSAIDKAAGDIYAKQGFQVEAQTYYRKAMARESIDPGVYVAYANSLLASRNFKDAPFFYALARRFDPDNLEAVIGAARCLAEAESVNGAVSYLMDEMQRLGGNRAELLAAVAELQIQKGDWDSAQRSVDQAKEANPDYAQSYKIQGRIHLARESVDKNALELALQAFKSFSDRNPSDPTGYLERYRVFSRLGQYEHAGEELDKVYVLFPKFPALHFYKGSLYALMGNHKSAVEEFRQELQNSPNSPEALLGLGKSQVELGAIQEALGQFQKAMALRPGSAEAKALAAYANFLLKNYPASIALYQAALALDRGNPLLYKRLGLVYRAMGDAVQARNAFRKYLEMEPDAADKAEFQKFL